MNSYEALTQLPMSTIQLLVRAGIISTSTFHHLKVYERYLHYRNECVPTHEAAGRAAKEFQLSVRMMYRIKQFFELEIAAIK